MPITIGVNTVLSFFVLILIFQLAYKAQLSKVITAIASSAVILILIAISEVLNILFLSLLYGQEKATQLINSSNGLTQSLGTLPSTVFYALFVFAGYFILKEYDKRKEKMETLARKLANKIALSVGCDKEKEAVIAYGLFAVIQIAITIILVAIIGILAGVCIEALIICFSASILRKYSGGAHAETANLCTCISVIYCTLTAIISKKLLLFLYSPVPMIIAIAIIYGLSYLIIYKYAPVDSPNKPIKTEKKKSRLRKGSFFTLSVYILISIILLILGCKYAIPRSYGTSLLFGVFWQVFTLTPYGSFIFEKINHFFVRKEVLK